jgi:ATP/maltotriose-dependent transcriptional regulator MalT
LLTRLREKWQQQLGEAAYTAAWERGTKLNIEETVKLLETDYRSLLRQSTGSSGQSLPDALTIRELEVLGLMATGLSNRAIAEQLVISVGTAKWYVSQILSKLAVNSRTQAIARARELQLIL